VNLGLSESDGIARFKRAIPSDSAWRLHRNGRRTRFELDVIRYQ